MPDENTRITLDTDLKTANVILSALAELPWRISNETIVLLRNQIMEQIEPKDNVKKFNNTGD